MTKILKKIGLLVIAGIILIQPALIINAQPNLSNLDPDRLGSITINRFAGTTPSNPTAGTPLNGIPYTVELVQIRSDIDQTTADLRDVANFEPIPLATGGFSATGSTTNGSVSFVDLPQGIYLVTENEHTVTPESDRVAPFIVGIPRRVAEGDGEVWLYDVIVYPKAEEDTIVDLTKSVTLGWDENVDDFVATWELTTTIPRLIGNATRFEFVDNLDDRLTLINGSVTGTFWRMEDVDGTLTPTAQTLMENTHFQVSLDEVNNVWIELTAAGISTLSQNAILAPTGTLTFNFSTIVSTVETDLGSVTNTATLYYNDNAGITATASTYPQFAMEIEKIDINRNRLAGASFEVFFDEAENYPAFPNAQGVNRTFTTGTDGLVFIPALQAGTFYLRETNAPAGHRIIADNMRVIVDAPHTSASRNYVVELQVVNEIEGGFNLPATGGIGAIIFSTTGVILIGTATILLVLIKRRKDSYE